MKDYLDIIIGGAVLGALFIAGNYSHVVERQLIHLFSSAGVYLMVYLLLDSIGRRTGVRWLTRRVEPAALIAMVFIWFGEPDDVANDGNVKSYIDMLVWAGGFAVSIMALGKWCKSRSEAGRENW